jgi:hypothetical protein
MTWLWGLAAALALLWPDHVRSPFDGVPLDHPAEAIIVGVLFPALWWFHPVFLNRRLARAAIVLLLAWRAVSAAFFVQEGWCVRFTPSRPYVRDETGAPHAWDLRADWRARNPVCSAVMTRSYEQLNDFPAWFFNLPPVVPDGRITPEDRPPGATVTMTVRGFVHTQHSGLLEIDRLPGDPGSASRAILRIDGGPETTAATLTPGAHAVGAEAILTGDSWRFSPSWNGSSIWTSLTGPILTLRRPSTLDATTRRTARWLPLLLVLFLLGGWAASLLRRIADPVLIGWSAAASTGLAWMVMAHQADEARWATAALLGAAALPFARRNRNLSGAFLAIGAPWLAYVVARSAPLIGRFTLYEVGDDFWTFQRYAYRIVMQGYWLEGGSPTFWFQPLYRWIAGLLHVVFGDSSVGEWYWDSACLAVGALFTFRVVRVFASFRLGLAAAVLPLATLLISAPRDQIGRGLSEISSAGFLYLGALLVMRARTGSLRPAILAGICAVLGFYVRLNNLPMAAGVAAFAIPPDLPARAALHVALWRRRVCWRTAAIVPGCLGIGALLFAWRTWHYTGIFSVFYGTQRDHLATWGPGVSISAAAGRIAESLLMILTVNDPPRFDPHALAVLGGAAICGLAALGTPKLRQIPLQLVLFFFTSIAGAIVARGSAYPGRFSIHLIPVTCAALACGIAALTSRPARQAELRGRAQIQCVQS